MRWLVVFLIACGDRENVPEQRPIDPDELTSSELAELASMRRAKPAEDLTNQYADNPAAVTLGAKLFFDPGLSGPLVLDSELGKVGERGKVSCHTCHAGPAMDDRGKPLSIGTGRGTRNSPPLVNAAHYTWANWAGRFDSQWSLSVVVIEKPEVMNGSRVDLARLIVEKHRADYEALFGKIPALDPTRFPAGARPKEKDWDRMSAKDRELVDRIYVNAAKTIAAYLRTLEGRDAPFDRFANGTHDAINTSAKRGFRLFLKHCKVCHSGPQFSDNRFHALAVAQFGDGVPKQDHGRVDDAAALLASPYNADGPFSDRRDPGRLDGARREKAVAGAFRTPTLRNVALTAPYMHDGLFKTLANVVAFYNAGGGEVEGVTKDPELTRLGLTDREQADLVEFMQTLTDASLPKPP